MACTRDVLRRNRLRLVERALCGRHDGGKRLGLADCQIGQDLPVKFQPGELYPMHELRISHAVLTHAGVDTLDPQATEIALLIAAIAVGVAECLLDLLDRDPVDGAATPATAFGEAENLLLAAVGGGGPRDPRPAAAPPLS